MKALLILMLTALSFSASAEKRTLEIELGRYTDTLVVKKLIRRSHPRLNLRNYRLESVEITAKYASGTKADLLIDDEYQRDGSERLYRNKPKDNRKHASAVLYADRGRQDGGPWVIELSSSVKVQKLVVELKERRRRGGGNNGDRKSCDSGQPVQLRCSVKYRGVKTVDATIDCGLGYQDEFCKSVLIPGYEQIKVKLGYTCDNGEWKVDYPAKKAWCELKVKR